MSSGSFVNSVRDFAWLMSIISVQNVTMIRNDELKLEDVCELYVKKILCEPEVSTRISRIKNFISSDWVEFFPRKVKKVLTIKNTIHITSYPILNLVAIPISGLMTSVSSIQYFHAASSRSTVCSQGYSVQRGNGLPSFPKKPPECSLEYVGRAAIIMPIDSST